MTDDLPPGVPPEHEARYRGILAFTKRQAAEFVARGEVPGPWRTPETSALTRLQIELNAREAVESHARRGSPPLARERLNVSSSPARDDLPSNDVRAQPQPQKG